MCCWPAPVSTLTVRPRALLCTNSHPLQPTRELWSRSWEGLSCTSQFLLTWTQTPLLTLTEYYDKTRKHHVDHPRHCGSLFLKRLRKLAYIFLKHHKKSFFKAVPHAAHPSSRPAASFQELCLGTRQAPTWQHWPSDLAASPNIAHS